MKTMIVIVHPDPIQVMDKIAKNMAESFFWLKPTMERAVRAVSALALAMRDREEHRK